MKKSTAYWNLHIAVVLLGATAILGDLISLSASVLVGWRTLIASISIGLFLYVSGKWKAKWLTAGWKIYVLGFLVAIHWLCFFGSVKVANASTALICFATITLFTAFIEPWVTGRPKKNHEVIFGLLVIPGIVLIAGKAEGQLMTGIILGIVAALLVAIISSFEKKYITDIDPEHMTFLQMVAAFGTMAIWIGGEYLAGKQQSYQPTVSDWIYLLILGVICTGIAWLLAIRAMKAVTAFDSLMIINLEPVYGIIMALFLLDDHKELSTHFYIGAGIILATVIAHPLWQRYHDRQSNSTIRGHVEQRTGSDPGRN